MLHIIDSQKLRSLIKTGQKALKGDSNDAEHDALYEIVAALESLETEDTKDSERPNVKDT